MGLLDGRVAFVTGAARGMGRNHAVRFAQEGASVIAVDLCGPIAAADYDLPGPEGLEETAQLIEKAGGRAFTRIVDVRDAEGLQAAHDAGVQALDADGGAVDIVVANAGISRSSGGLLDTPAEIWRETIDINLTGVFLTIQVAGKAMVARKRGGSIILISSIMGLRSYGGVPAYTAAKHGVVGLMRTGAQEFARAGVRVNSIHPGNVNTDMINNQAIRHLFRPDLEAPTADDVAAGFQGMNLMQHPWVEKDDITEAVLWLASDLSRYVTGISLPVDLGALAK
ncbi:MAG: short-chain dehydrogenase/reductase [Mycobacterium sp.]|nr:short-chain dehydrogenase/reductase [Mycobacterium sp.]